MKTNKILMAVALPALLAACTAEEVVEQSPVANLSGRALLDPNFSVNVAEGIDSRFAWEGLNWKYEGDQFGAGVVDPAELGTISETSMIGNYIFVKDEAGAFKTNSQMQEGTYLFYSYGGFDKKNVRSLVSFDITSQKTDLSDPEAMLNDYANQLMFSPLYDIEAEYSAEAMPMEFRSFWGVAAFKFKNNTGQTLRINQIILKEATADNQFVVKGGINPKALNDAGLKYVYNENGAKYNGTEGKANEHNYVPAAVSAEIDKELTATYKEADKVKAIEKLYEAFEAKLYTTKASKDVTGNGSSSFIAMNCQNYKMKHGETVTAYMLVPVHDGKNMSVEIMVVDEEDESWSVFVEDETQGSVSKDVEGLDGLDIVRHKTNAIFGKTTDGKSMKTLSIVEDDLAENSGYYIDNNTALKALINANLGKITVHNTGDTYIDKDIVEAIKEYTGTHVTFSNAIEIKSAEALVDDADTDTELALTQITFNGGAIVKGKNAKKDINGTVGFGSSVKFGVGQTLTVEEDANVTLSYGAYSNIINNGNLVVEKNVTGLTVKMSEEELATRAMVDVALPINLVNKAGSATLKIDEVEVTAEAGSVSFAGASNNKLAVAATDLAIAAGANLTIGEYVTLTVDENETIAVAYDAEKDVWAKSTWTNNGTINIASGKKLTVNNALVNNGIIANAGTLETVYTETLKKDGTTKTYVKPNITVGEDGEVNVATIIVNDNSTVTNAGEFGWDMNSTVVEVYGDVTMVGSSSRLEVTKCVKEVVDGDDIEGMVDNSANGVVKAPEGMLIAATVGAMTDGETLKNFDVDGQINMIIVTDTWTITANEDNESAKDALDELGIKTVRFAVKNAVDVRSNAILDLSGVNVELYGKKEIIFSGRTEETSTLILSAEPKPCGEYEYETGKYTNETAVYNNIAKTQSVTSVLAALEASTAENPVKLFANVSEEITYNPEDATATAFLDLNGFDIVSETNGILVKNGTLTIKGKRANQIKSVGVGTYAAVEANGANAKVIIEEGTYTAGLRENGYGNAAVDTRNGGKVEIKNGYFYAQADRHPANSEDVYFVVNYDDTDNSGSKIEIKGGEFLNFNPARTGTEPAGQNDNLVSSGYQVDIYKDGAKLTTYQTDWNERYVDTGAYKNENKDLIYKVVPVE